MARCQAFPRRFALAVGSRLGLNRPPERRSPRDRCFARSGRSLKARRGLHPGRASHCCPSMGGVAILLVLTLAWPPPKPAAAHFACRSVCLASHSARFVARRSACFTSRSACFAALPWSSPCIFLRSSARSRPVARPGRRCHWSWLGPARSCGLAHGRLRWRGPWPACDGRWSLSRPWQARDGSVRYGDLQLFEGWDQFSFSDHCRGGQDRPPHWRPVACRPKAAGCRWPRGQIRGRPGAA